MRSGSAIRSASVNLERTTTCRRPHDQLSIDFARASRDEGISRAVDRADRAVAGWSDLAFEFVKLYAQQNKGRRFIGRDITQAAKEWGLAEPTNEKAWGGPLQRAARAGVIRKVGAEPDPNRHMALVPLWTA